MRIETTNLLAVKVPSSQIRCLGEQCKRPPNDCWQLVSNEDRINQRFIKLPTSRSLKRPKSAPLDKHACLPFFSTKRFLLLQHSSCRSSPK